MIARYLFLRLEPAWATAQGRRDVLAELAALRAVPELIELWAGPPADDSALGSWDVGAVLRFESLAALGRFLADPRVQAFYASLGARAVVQKSWSFEC